VLGRPGRQVFFVGNTCVVVVGVVVGGDVETKTFRVQFIRVDSLLVTPKVVVDLRGDIVERSALFFVRFHGIKWRFNGKKMTIL
jgi:hypothetical protein